MAVSPQTTRVRRVLLALVIAGVFIFGAYLISNPNFFAPSAANAESTQVLLQAYAQKKGPDGLPLWEEQLIATASSTAWANTASSTTDLPLAPAPDAAAGSLTDTFAQNLFTQYMQERGDAQPSDTDIDTFAENAIQQLIQTHSQENPYSPAQVQVSGNDSTVFSQYASAAEDAFNNNTIPSTETGIDAFSDGVEKGDTASFKQVAAEGTEYTAVASALMKIQVPIQAETAHLEIANALARMGEDYTDMSTFQTDPLRSYLGLNSYIGDAISFTQGISDMNTVFATNNIVIREGQPGYSFYLTLGLGETASTSSP